MVLWEMLVPSQPGWLLEAGSDSLKWFPFVLSLSLSSIYQPLETAAGHGMGGLSHLEVLLPFL